MRLFHISLAIVFHGEMSDKAQILVIAYNKVYRRQTDHAFVATLSTLVHFGVSRSRFPYRNKGLDPVLDGSSFAISY